MYLKSTTHGTPVGRPTRAAAANAAMAAALASIPAYVAAQATYDRLVEQAGRIPEPQSDAEMVTGWRKSVSAGNGLPADLLKKVSAAQTTRAAYAHASGLLNDLATEVLQDRDTAATDGIDIALAHLHDVAKATIAELAALKDAPSDPLSAIDAGSGDKWQRRQHLTATYGNVRDAQRTLALTVLDDGGTGLPDDIGTRWAHLAYVPDAAAAWDDPETFAHFLARGYIDEKDGTRKTLRPPYPAEGDHDAWAAWLVTTGRTPWVPSMAQLTEKARTLASLSQSVQRNEAAGRLSSRRAR